MNNKWNISYLIYNISQWSKALSYVLILIFENNNYIQAKIYFFIIYNINNIFLFNFNKRNFLISKFFLKMTKSTLLF